MKKRLDKWKEQEPNSFSPVINADENDNVLLFFREHQTKVRFTQTSLLKSCKELVFHINDDNQEVFTAVVNCIDAKTLQIKAEPILQIICNNEEDLISTIAGAEAYEIPVYPNDSIFEDRLIELTGKLHKAGFTAPNEYGEQTRLRLSKSPGESFFSHGLMDWVEKSDFQQRSVVVQALRLARSEIRRYEYAERVLSSINSALADLKKVLNSPHLEQDLHSCIQKYPILFGAEYVNIISKHNLGTEYQTDFVLERISGTIDVVELESDEFPVFTKRGNPSSKLIHAEQQVLDWLAWFEEHNAYERRNFPLLLAPIGWIVIGRSADINPELKKKLNQCNRLYWGRLQILTYDDLILRAENLIATLTRDPFQSDARPSR